MATPKRTARPARKRKEPTRKTLDQRKAFIAAYGISASITLAASAAGVDRKYHRRWLADENYRRAFEAAHEEIGAALEREAVRRAVEGVDKAVFYRGKPVKTGGRRGRQVYETTYSDTLLLALLKRFKPAQYREHTLTEVTGSIDLVERLNAGRQRLVEMRKNDGSAAG